MQPAAEMTDIVHILRHWPARWPWWEEALAKAHRDGYRNWPEYGEYSARDWRNRCPK